MSTFDSLDKRPHERLYICAVFDEIQVFSMKGNTFIYLSNIFISFAFGLTYIIYVLNSDIKISILSTATEKTLMHT